MTQPGAEQTADDKAATAPAPDDPAKPASPGQLQPRTWKFIARNALAEFSQDQCTDLAAALTYFAVLAVFPGLVAVVSLLGVVGQAEATTRAMLDLLGAVAPADMVAQLRGPIEEMARNSSSGFGLVVGIVGALWSASGYIGGFSRATNRIYEVDEGRPTLILRAQQLGLTVAAVGLACLILLGLVVSGPVADQAGAMLGVGDTGQLIFGIVKWPVILGAVVLLVALLYYAAPNVKQPKFRWMSIGALVAILAWIVLSLGFGFYVASFGNYNKTYGTLGGVVVFLLWLWITNCALLFGAELDAEIERGRQLQAGIAAEESIQLPPRDTKQSEKAQAKEAERVDEATGIRLEHAPESAGDPVPGRDGPSSATAGEEPRRAGPAGRDDPTALDRPGPEQQPVRKATAGPEEVPVLQKALSNARRPGPLGRLLARLRRP